MLHLIILDSEMVKYYLISLKGIYDTLSSSDITYLKTITPSFLHSGKTNKK